jgi:hypothetical protein
LAWQSVFVWHCSFPLSTLVSWDFWHRNKYWWNVHESFLLNELCFWTLSIVWCLKNKQNWGIKNYRQKITIHTYTNKSHKDQLLTTEQLAA